MTGLRIGLVCPYSFDRPGGVQNHVLGLAAALRGLGHHPAVLAPGVLPVADPDLVFTSAGPSLPVPYNGSVARVSFGPVTAGRVRRWLRDNAFDLAHLHEPITPSISLQALRFAQVPIVATYHTATPRSRTMQLAGDALRGLIEKVDAGIAVSESARDVVVRHLGRDAVVIPNGFDRSSFGSRPPIGPWRGGARPRITFLGRLDEPRKGLPVLLAALPAIRAACGDVEVCVAGHGTAPPRPALPPYVTVLGGIDEREKRELLARTDVFVAPQVARESFGIVVLEALSAGAEVVASDLPAFVDLLTAPGGEPAGVLFRRGDPPALAAAVAQVLAGGVRRQPAAARHAGRYDWSLVVPRILDVYATAVPVVPVGERLDRTWTALDEALVRRARRALEMSTPDLAAAARTALEAADQTGRERAESELSRLLVRAGLDRRDGLRSEHDRVTVARRLHNDAVAVAVRSRGAEPARARAFEMAES